MADVSSLRILHVLRSDHDGHVGGDLVQLEAMVNGLRLHGVDAHAATIDDAPDDVDVIHLYNLQRPAALLRDLRGARRRWPHAHVVLSPVWWPWHLRTMVKGGGRDLIATALKRGIKQVVFWPAERWILRTVELVLPNSHAEVDALRRRYRLGAPKGHRRWAVVPNGVDIEKWPFGRAAPAKRAFVLKDLGLDPAASPVIASVARIEPVKNQYKVVAALEDIPHAALILVGPRGEEAYAAEVDRLASHAALRGRVACTGRLSPPEIAELLTCVDVHILASYRETPGLATLEAAAAGCAVVVTSDGSAIEYLGDSAYVADPTEPGSIARAITDAAAEPRQPAARERVEGFSWEVAIDALLEAYRRLPPTTTRS